MDILDPQSAAVTAAIAYSMKESLNKLVGPSADLLGEQAKDAIVIVEQRVKRLYDIAIRKLGAKASVPGDVSPRILKQTIEEAIYCDDELVTEYLGGILASSRVEGGRDDRGVSHLSEVRSMSAYQVKVHYLVYTAMLRKGSPHPNQSLEHFCSDRGLTICIADADLRRAMRYSVAESHEEIMEHVCHGLTTRNLLKHGRYVAKNYEGFPPFRYFHTTPYGFELFCWAMGQRPPTSGDFFDVSEGDQVTGDEFDAMQIAMGEMFFGR
jgi:hypothetical protein